MTEAREADIRSLHEAGEHQDAATQALELYGREIFAFLVATMRDETAASEAFSAFNEDMWKGLPTFSWQASLRTWLYVIARRCAAGYHRSPHHRRERNVALSQVSEVAERIRTQTLAYLKTEAKDAIQRMREELEPDEQALLMLRIDKRMAWNEIAEVMHADEPDVDHKKAAARLRKRFQLLKDRLRKRAIAEGLVQDDAS